MLYIHPSHLSGAYFPYKHLPVHGSVLDVVRGVADVILWRALRPYEHDQ